jgi:hypothetical protein
MYTVSTNRSRTLYGYDTKDEALAHAHGVAAHGGTATVKNDITGGKAILTMMDGKVMIKVIPA